MNSTWVEEIQTGLRFASMRNEWGALAARSKAGPFLSWSWLYPWWQRLGFQRALRIFVAWDEEQKAVGILPLSQETTHEMGVPVRKWRFLGDTHVGSDYLDLLAEPEYENVLIESFAKHLAAKKNSIDVLELHGLPQGSAFSQAILKALGKEALVSRCSKQYTCPLVKIGDSWEQYLKSVGRTDNLRRRHKWFLSQPGFAIERWEDSFSIAKSVSEFFELHRLRWEKEGGSQGIHGPHVQSFHRDATFFMAQDGHVRMYILRLGNQPLSAVYVILWKNRVYFYQSGYDPQWTRRSAGLVLLGQTLADAFGEKRIEFDFLRGQEPYKFEWANDQRETEELRLVFPTPGGVAYLAALEAGQWGKKKLKQLVGPRVWKSLKNARNARIIGEVV